MPVYTQGRHEKRTPPVSSWQFFFWAGASSFPHIMKNFLLALTDKRCSDPAKPPPVCVAVGVCMCASKSTPTSEQPSSEYIRQILWKWFWVRPSGFLGGSWRFSGLVGQFFGCIRLDGLRPCVFAARFELPSPSCSLSCYGNFTPSPFQGQQQQHQQQQSWRPTRRHNLLLQC